MCKTITLIINHSHFAPLHNRNHNNNNNNNHDDDDDDDDDDDNNNNNDKKNDEYKEWWIQRMMSTLPSIHQRDPTHRIFKFGTPEVSPHAQKQPKQWVEVTVVFHSWLEWNMKFQEWCQPWATTRFQINKHQLPPD